MDSARLTAAKSSPMMETVNMVSFQIQLKSSLASLEVQFFKDFMLCNMKQAEGECLHKIL